MRNRLRSGGPPPPRALVLALRVLNLGQDDREPQSSELEESRSRQRRRTEAEALCLLEPALREDHLREGGLQQRPPRGGDRAPSRADSVPARELSAQVGLGGPGLVELAQRVGELAGEVPAVFVEVEGVELLGEGVRRL